MSLRLNEKENASRRNGASGELHMKTVKIAGTGSYLPARVVTNDEIAAQIESSHEWIFSHTGIESRHVAAPEESAASMSAEASRRALEAAGARPEEIGLIILGTTTPDYVGCPSTACIVQEALGCKNAAAFDLSAACSGFVYGLEMARCYLLCHPGMKALVIGTEVLSRSLNWRDRSNAILFGDGAGAAVLELCEAPDSRLAGGLLGADGSGSSYIVKESAGKSARTSDPVHEFVDTENVQYLTMDGHAVFAFAVRKLDEVVRQLCANAGIEPESLDWIFAHQANMRIIEATARRLKLPLEKFYMFLSTVGNTSSASIPLCLDKAVREGTLKPGTRLALAGFGSGLTWAGALMEWPYL